MNIKKDVPLAHAGMAAQFDLQKQYYAEGEVFISSKSNQPSNVPNYVTIATQEAPPGALKSYPPQLFGSY
jgi:hypothetical protein